jgi:hypothetical protein
VAAECLDHLRRYLELHLRSIWNQGDNIMATATYQLKPISTTAATARKRSVSTKKTSAEKSPR